MNIVTEIAVSVMVLSMLATLFLAWRMTGSFRLGFIIMLIVGKVWAATLWAFGIDRPLFNIVLYNKIRHTASTITITADQFVFLSFLSTLVFVLLWPLIEPSLPPWLRGINLISRGERK